MNLVPKLFRSPIAASSLVSIFVFLCIVGLRSAGSLESIELMTYDWYIRLQPESSPIDSPIVLIEITERDIQNQGRWSLTDATIARALEILVRSQPCAVGLDLYRDIPVPPGREEFEEILTRNQNIIAAMKFAGEKEVSISPPAVMRDTEQVGFNDVLIDPGGIVRRGLLFLDDGKNLYYSFALRLALIYLQSKGIRPQPDDTHPQHLRLGQTTIQPLGPNGGGYVRADARGYQFLLDFKNARKPFLSLSLTALLSGEIAPGVIRDKIVLLGTRAEGIKDFFFTPFSHGLHADQQISGVALHGHMVDQLIRFALKGDLPIGTLGKGEEWLWIFLWSLAGGILAVGVRSPWRFSLLAFGGLLILAIAAYFAFLKGWWVPIVPPAMTWFISATVITAYMSNKERKERASLMQLFSRHVSKEIAETLWKQRDQILEGGRLRSQKSTVTVMFTDLKGFTTVSESMDPQALIDWLNTYMEAMVQLVIDHGGVIDEYIGDGFKADFGIPLPRTTESDIRQDAINAAHCALAMEKEIKRLNTLLQEHDLPTVKMRVGIFTGPVVAGSIGSMQRLKYTTIGDTVNIASRLESFDKDLAGKDSMNSPCRILIGETTLHYLGNQFMTEELGELSLKGKVQKITAYCLVCRADGQTDSSHSEETI
ncbi:MAG: hypothetical protein A2157_02485 [Deltaproteobacteria bacterium RBG_16_47_11]|nr:MAG: hypothetical protein A2157_02485 [Deltaproteobacteria bacterium RBG_16_47_11]